jgi:predicted metal-dependent peptidase
MNTETDDLPLDDENDQAEASTGRSDAEREAMRQKIKKIKKISGEDWMEISRQLEQHHAVFYKVWEMGVPVFSDQVPTAAIQFDKGGDFVLFHFNPEFWEACTPYERLFTICHEALHVILNHGVRMKDTDDPKACNVGLDIVVNHLLTRSFGFDRTQISNWEKLCWVDTVFKQPDGSLKTDKGKPIPDDDCFEYYINLFERIPMPRIKMCGKGKGQPMQGNANGQPEDGDGDGLQTVDDHSKMNDSDFEEIIDRLDKGLSDEEKESLKNIIDKHFEKEEAKAGTGTGGQWHFAQTDKPKKKKKWETIIKKWSLKYRLDHHKELEQWARLNRRFQFLPSKLFLPSDMEIEEIEQEKHRIKVYFFLDTSGSCWGLKDRFFQAAESLPEERFDIRLFCFDTTVQETDLASKKMYGGGGTSFSIIESFIQKNMQKQGDSGKYPEAVFVITDGWGDRVRPAEPEKWYWFISGATPYNLKSVVGSYIPAECNIFNLNDFE